ncbi:MAG: hypothetical protein Nk1A_6740 [Endomicrobiia bacterium]|nr:MAG: hypothetical protein Nk1A_6740 [Endomicrobiia bacterium]
MDENEKEVPPPYLASDTMTMDMSYDNKNYHFDCLQKSEGPLLFVKPDWEQHKDGSWTSNYAPDRSREKGFECKCTCTSK